MQPQSPAAPSLVMDVVAPPPAEKPVVPVDAPAVVAEQQPKAKHQKAITKQPAQPKQPGTGVGMAIFATVVIVLGLAALATYAYLKTAR